jgi:hypothetical protein
VHNVCACHDVERRARATARPLAHAAYAGSTHALLSLVRERPGQYVVAVQDGPLRGLLRRIPGAIIVFAYQGGLQVIGHALRPPPPSSHRSSARISGLFTLPCIVWWWGSLC